MRALIEILGSMLCRTIPIESLSKPRGTNNDSLKGAKDTRLVLISESNGRAKIDVGTYNAVVCGEETTTKGMYEKEINFIPVMKLMFFLNDLPEWKTSDGRPPFHIQRRSAYLRLKKMFLDSGRESDQKMIEELRSIGKEYLIGKKDTSYYENHVEGHEKAFLHFFVLGAMAYYTAGKKIPIPESMQLQAKAESFNTAQAVEEFVSDWLRPSYEKTQLVKDLYEKFLIVFPDTDRDLYALAAFGRDLALIIKEKKSQLLFGPDGWGVVTNAVIRKNGVQGSGWKNLDLLPSVN
jgi:phage/plasmid-associated DNA primase